MPYILNGQVLADDDPRAIAARQRAPGGSSTGGHSVSAHSLELYPLFLAHCASVRCDCRWRVTSDVVVERRGSRPVPHLWARGEQEGYHHGSSLEPPSVMVSLLLSLSFS